MSETNHKELANALRADVEALCDLGPRALTVRRAGAGVGGNTLTAARDWLLSRVGRPWHAEAQPFDTPDGPACNLELRHRDAPESPAGRVLLVGAHYDTWRGTPGADDNASAVAALLHMLDDLRAEPAAKAGRVRFALYANEEPPYFQTRDMGSLHHADNCQARGWDVEMLCLESLGFYSDEPDSQQDPTGGLLGTVGDFLALEADEASAGLLSRLRAGYAAGPGGPVRLAAAALPRELCSGASDHWSYWQHGYPAVMATDTALYRNPHYHRPSDRPETLDYPRLAAVATRLAAAVRAAATLANVAP